MTGLDVMKDTIMEMACIVTDKHLNVLEEGPNIVIHQEDEQLDNMGEWCTLQHHKTGLTQQCKDSTITTEQCEDTMIEFIKKYCPKGRCELAGNSIHCDRKFLERYMPRFVEMIHYRIIDVSSIRNVAWRWFPNFEKYQSENPCSHRALDDIRSSIQELSYYRETVFKSKDQYKADIAQEPQPDTFDVSMSRCEALMSRRSTSCHPDQDQERKQEPVKVQVNGASITLFGN